jgi:hypothetical protein
MDFTEYPNITGSYSNDNSKKTLRQRRFSPDGTPLNNLEIDLKSNMKNSKENIIGFVEDIECNSVDKKENLQG